MEAGAMNILRQDKELSSDNYKKTEKIREKSKRVIELGQRRLGGQFLLLNFDELCLHPRPTIKALAEFLGFEVSAQKLEELAKLPRVPPSMGRYKKYNLGAFSVQELEAVRSLGFDIEDVSAK